jgi:Fe2+ transport system protein FeoA
MNAGEVGAIAEIDGDVDAVTRLRELGIREGAQIEMVQTGEPCIIAVGNQRLSLRIDQTTSVYVEVGV